MLWDHIHTDCLPGGAWRGYLGLLTARGARRGNFGPKPPKVLKGDLRRPKLKIAKSAAASRPPALKHPKQARHAGLLNHGVHLVPILAPALAAHHANVGLGHGLCLPSDVREESEKLPSLSSWTPLGFFRSFQFRHVMKPSTIGLAFCAYKVATMRGSAREYMALAPYLAAAGALYATGN